MEASASHLVMFSDPILTKEEIRDTQVLILFTALRTSEWATSNCTADSQSTPRHAHAPHSRELSPDEHVEVELPRVTTVIAPYDVAPN